MSDSAIVRWLRLLGRVVTKRAGRRELLWPLRMASALILLLLAAAAPATAADYPNAVVLVSGVESDTPFSTPDPSCAGQEGPAWAPTIAPALRTGGVAVFTAPAGPDGLLSFSCTAGGPDVSPGQIINSNGDVDVNGQALAAFLTFLQQNYGLEQVQLVSHSDGGLWSRSAITQQTGGPTILSLTTIGTPHTGSFVADVATHAANFPCTGLADKARCAAIRAVAKVVFDEIGETALYQLSSPFLAGWNQQQQIGSCPITTIAGTASNEEVFAGASSYYNPSDGLVGEASGLNQTAPALDQSEIAAAPGLNVVSRLTFPDYHTPALGRPDELTDPALAAAVLGAVQRGSTVTCSATGTAPIDLVTVPITIRTVGTIATTGQLPASRPGDAVVATRRTRVSCGGRRLVSHAVRGRKGLSVTILGRCRRKLVVRGGRAVFLREVRGVRLEVILRGARVRIVRRKGRLDDVRAEVRVGRHWRHLKLDAKLRGRLPRRATGLRVSARLEHGRRASAVALLSR
jgi:triacylglycerol lipase